MQDKHWLIIVSVVALAACEWKQPNPARCPGGASCPLPGGYCESSSECRAPTPVCDEPNMACVECLANTDCAATRPICNDQRMCVQCASDDNCDSKLCLSDGTCAAPGDVTYVAEGGMANPECKLDTPCQNLEQAQAPTALRKYIKVSGAIVHAKMTEFNDKSVIIYGSPGSRLSTSASETVLLIKGTSVITLNNLEIVGNPMAGSGKHCVEIAEKAVVTMAGVVVRNHGQAGVSLSSIDAKLTMADSKIHDHTREGLLVTGGTLEVRRSLIYGNKGVAGISSTDASMVTIESSTIASNTASSGVAITGRFAIRNSIIARNGTANSTVGGLNLSSTSGLLEFTTISNNVADIGGNGGISCTGTVAVTNSIIVNNAGTVPIDTSCNVSFSLTGTTGVPFPGRDNKVGEPRFLDTMNHLAPNFYRIESTSVARGMADSTSPVDVDIDGQSRDDGAKDMGADEYK